MFVVYVVVWQDYGCVIWIGQVDCQFGWDQVCGIWCQGQWCIDVGLQVQVGVVRGGVGRQLVFYVGVEDFDVDGFYDV